MPTLVEKVEACRGQLSLATSDAALPAVVEQIAAALGMTEALAGQPLMDQADACHEAIFGAAVLSTDAAAAPGLTVVTGTVVSGTPVGTASLAAQVVLEEEDVRGFWVSKSNGWNIRDKPTKQGGVVVQRVGKGTVVEASEHLGDDWVAIAAPAELAGRVVRLHNGGKRMWKKEADAVPRIVAEAAAADANPAAAAAAAAKPKPQPKPQPNLNFSGERLWDKRLHPNGGPREDQPVACLPICCAAPFAVCPLHALSAWGCAPAVDALTGLPMLEAVPCAPCSANSKNPLWCCAEPIGWAASLGQLHTVMVLVKNGANPRRKNAAGETAFSDAKRERHEHVVKWLEAWEREGGAQAPAALQMRRAPPHKQERKEGFDARDVEGCYVGACAVPVLVTTFWLQASAPDELRATGFTLICPWSFKLKRGRAARTFELRSGDTQQDWAFHPSGCCMWGSPGWWAVKLLPSCCAGAYL